MESLMLRTTLERVSVAVPFKDKEKKCKIPAVSAAAVLMYKQ